MAKLRQADAVLAFVPYPFFVEHGAQLHLSPLVQADVTDVGLQQRWTLVAKSGGLTDSKSMAGYTVLSAAGYAPEFVRHSALQAWALPADVKIEVTGQILSALRRAAAGEPVAVLLDQTQSAALPSLPFAAQLKTLTQSAALPVALIVVVDSRLPAARAKALQTGFLKMNQGPGGIDSLGALRLRGFVLPKLPSASAAP
jgi:ABC-type phosphate/phosphonate transport system substrate-binding protein